MITANKKIFWVTSYPKSGNTWMRAILSSLFFTNNGKFDFDLLNLITNFETLKRFEFVKSVNSNDFNKLKDLKTIAKYWVEAQQRIDFGEGDFTFFKTHSANISLYDYEFTNKINTLGGKPDYDITKIIVEKLDKVLPSLDLK